MKPELSSRLKAIVGILVCSLLLLPVLACVRPAEPPGPMGMERPAAVVIIPVSGLPRAPITIIGAGFVPGEIIEVIMVVDDVPMDLGRRPMVKEANEQGAFRATGFIPRVAEPGVYTITAIGDKGTIAVFPLEVAE